MKLVVPSTIQIGGHTYSIVFNKGLEDSNDYGSVNHRIQKIELNPVRPVSQRVGALIHEIVHIINNVYAVRHLDEDDIDAISEGLSQVFMVWFDDFDFSQVPHEND